jgi:hypothetical protein
MLGLVFVKQGMISQALLHFAEALRLNPTDMQVAQNLRQAQALDATRIQGLR